MPGREHQAAVSVLRRLPSLSALPHLVSIVSDFFGPAPTLSLSRACATGSIELLEFIWDSSPTSRHQTEFWSLCNYLRSDPHYHQWEFGESLEVAAASGNLGVVEWLFAHFSGCVVPVQVVEAAAKNGHENVLDFLVEHDAGEECVIREGVTLDPPSKRITVPQMPADWTGPGNAVTWGGRAMLYAVQNNHLDTAIWMYEHPFHSGYRTDPNELDRIVDAALSNGFVELVAKILSRDNWHNWPVVYDRLCPDPERIETLMKEGFYLVEQDAANRAILTLARTGRLDLMQRMDQLDSPEPANALARILYWKDALGEACKRGGLPMLKWMVEHPTGNAVLKSLNPNDAHAGLLGLVAEQDSLEVLKYLHGQGITDPFGDALVHMVRMGKLDFVRWMVEHITYTHAASVNAVFMAAAMSGKLEVLQFLMAVDPSTVPRSEGCTATAFDNAMSFGHLRCAFWLAKLFPEYVPVGDNLPMHVGSKFEMLLFVHGHFPVLFSPLFVELHRALHSNMLRRTALFTFYTGWKISLTTTAKPPKWWMSK
ncbi:hypothetical protein PHYPSEUDO_006765 [Phytophthora pseudosyringae]|uniref:Ankyrin repeat protein n=1 Tax=Phytophthora pseudosyringae TaxID=221518 RepID=A0A8T1VHV5_9STRA|nr:hypothetical protein PHYPSEUDO_006765 [Phytophthora pseudosyringae]